MSRLAGLYRKGSHVPESTRPGFDYRGRPLPAPSGATFGPWATHAARCTCNVCR